MSEKQSIPTTEYCVWDNEKHMIHREATSEADAQEWIDGWLRRHAILGDMATSPADRFTLRSRQITHWSEVARV